MKSTTVEYQNGANDTMIGIITDLQENTKINGFRMSFRVYNATEGIGGFETTVIVENAAIACAKMFVSHIDGDIKQAAKMVGGKVVTLQHNNKVPVGFQFRNVAF
jgi:hypothetical protein